MDRNRQVGNNGLQQGGSLSARRAWIEIDDTVGICGTCSVALRKESVDRNKNVLGALTLGQESLSARRAWIEILFVYLALIRYLSLSARRAWIEMFLVLGQSWCIRVALRKESVDRNTFDFPALSLPFGSLSARRAWIEIV